MTSRREKRQNAKRASPKSRQPGRAARNIRYSGLMTARRRIEPRMAVARRRARLETKSVAAVEISKVVRSTRTARPTSRIERPPTNCQIASEGTTERSVKSGLIATAANLPITRSHTPKSVRNKRGRVPSRRSRLIESAARTTAINTVPSAVSQNKIVKNAPPEKAAEEPHMRVAQMESARTPAPKPVRSRVVNGRRDATLNSRIRSGSTYIRHHLSANLYTSFPHE